MVHHLLFDDFGKFMFPIVHGCIASMMILFLFDLIYLNVDISIGLGLQLLTCVILCTVGFRAVSYYTTIFTEATQSFLHSYSKYNMPEMSEANKKELRACESLKLQIKPLFTYGKLTFVQGIQDVVIINTIDLLLTYK